MEACRPAVNEASHQWQLMARSKNSFPPTRTSTGSSFMIGHTTTIRQSHCLSRRMTFLLKSSESLPENTQEAEPESAFTRAGDFRSGRQIRFYSSRVARSEWDTISRQRSCSTLLRDPRSSLDATAGTLTSTDTLKLRSFVNRHCSNTTMCPRSYVCRVGSNVFFSRRASSRLAAAPWLLQDPESNWQSR